MKQSFTQPATPATPAPARDYRVHENYCDIQISTFKGDDGFYADWKVGAVTMTTHTAMKNSRFAIREAKSDIDRYNKDRPFQRYLMG